MQFVAQLLREKKRKDKAKVDVIETVTFESDDLFSVVARLRSLLSSSDPRSTISAFQIVSGTDVIYEKVEERPLAKR